MTPVDQSKLHTGDAIGNGNCWTAALASLLDLPLWMVPPFEDMPDAVWFTRTCEWLARTQGKMLIETQGHKAEVLPEFYIVSGKSVRGVLHAVVFRNGELAHDPHPSRSGVESIKRTYHLEALDA